MPNILKPLSAPVDINSAANTVNDSLLVSVTNMNTSAVLVNNTTTGNGIYIGSGERVFFEKNAADELHAPASNASSVWASEVAYKA